MRADLGADGLYASGVTDVLRPLQGVVEYDAFGAGGLRRSGCGGGSAAERLGDGGDSRGGTSTNEF
ncbi:hypothetical protein GCM10010319_39350 [Streptomyces blastmyceticus]|uniref:Uncharacterized protein n=1 Tax=Streptomyces blastmyceticus TaxID=68180 RepID=A0ABN0X9S6_9ACTN